MPGGWQHWQWKGLTCHLLGQAMGENMMGAVRGFGEHLAQEQQGKAEGSSTDSVFFDLGGFMMVGGPSTKLDESW